MTGTAFENLAQVDISEITADFLPNRLTYLQKSVISIARKIDTEIESLEDCIECFEGSIYGWKDYTDETGEYCGGIYMIVFGAPETIHVKIDGERALVTGDMYGEYFEYPLGRATKQLVEFFTSLYNC